MIFGVLFLYLVSMQKVNAVKMIKLSSGYEIPVVGLGTSSIKIEEIDHVISKALKNGYMHIDTAFAYHNEAEIGKVLRKWFNSTIKRKDLFITSKLPPQGNRPESVEKYLNRSLEDLGLDYIDMYLIHKPWAFQEDDNYSVKKENGFVIFENIDHIALWKAMENQVKNNRVNSIGLSNFNQSQVLTIYSNAKIKPSNLQVESHAYMQQKDLRHFCKKYNIVMTAFSPLGSAGTRREIYKNTDKDLRPLVDLPEIKKIAHKYKKNAGQILLRHSIQENLVVIPKSSNTERQKANIDIFDFELTDEEMKMIDSLDIGERGRVFDFIASHMDHHKNNSQYPFINKS